MIRMISLSVFDKIIVILDHHNISIAIDNRSSFSADYLTVKVFPTCGLPLISLLVNNVKVILLILPIITYNALLSRIFLPFG